ncbi:MAG: cytidylate kinase family protein [Bryobacteraceae bacterium]
MAVVTVCGEPGCRADQAAKLAAQQLGFELVSDASLRQMIIEEFFHGSGEPSFPDRAYRPMLASIVARLAVSHHFVLCAAGAESIVHRFPGAMRAMIMAPLSFRVGTLMLDDRLERPAATALLKRLDGNLREQRRKRFGRALAAPPEFDLIVNAESMDSEHVAGLIAAAVEARGLREEGFLSATAEAQLQFHARLQLARHGITASGRSALRRAAFQHPSEEIFANLLDFYRIAWEYEPRSFPLQWDADGRVLESFTPDFHLPEFNLYVELTTMKQAHVTRKNRKVKRLRAVHPNVNIQVFYQKDIQDLIFKHGLAERSIAV